MVKIYMKDTAGNSGYVELADNEKLLIMTREYIGKLLRDEAVVPPDIKDLVMRALSVQVEVEKPAYGYRVRYDAENEEYKIEPIDVPQVAVPGMVLVSKDEIRWPEGTDVKIITTDVVEFEQEGVATRIGVGDHSKSVVEAVDKPKVALELEIYTADKGERVQLGSKELVLETGKTYFLGRPTKEIMEKHGKEHGVSPLGVYLYDEEGNVYAYFGETVAVSRQHAKITVTEDGKILIEDYGPSGEGSKNGTYVNGRKLEKDEKAELSESDEFSLGTALIYRVNRITPINVEEARQEETSRYELMAPEESILSPEEEAKETLRSEAESVHRAIAGSVTGVQKPEVHENIEKALDEVEKAGAEIEREVLDSLLPTLTSMKTSIKPQESRTWFRLLREVNKRLGTAETVPSAEDVKTVLESDDVKTMIKDTIAETIKNGKLFQNGREVAMKEALRLNDNEIEAIAERLTERLVSSDEFVSLVRGGVASIRHGILSLPSRYEITVSYKHAIRLNGYVMSTTLEELSDKLAVDTEFLKEFRSKLVMKTEKDIERIMSLTAPIRTEKPVVEEMAKREKKTPVEEEELVSN